MKPAVSPRPSALQVHTNTNTNTKHQHQHHHHHHHHHHNGLVPLLPLPLRPHGLARLRVHHSRHHGGGRSACTSSSSSALAISSRKTSSGSITLSLSASSSSSSRLPLFGRRFFRRHHASTSLPARACGWPQRHLHRCRARAQLRLHGASTGRRGGVEVGALCT